MDKTFVFGDEVYTVNASTNQVDTWTFAGFYPTAKGLLLLLDNGKKRGLFSPKCVFMSKDEAQIVANK